MHYGFTKEDVMRTAFAIAAHSGRAHPLQNGAAGCSWFESWCPNLTAQLLSFACAAAAKLGSFCAWLNLLGKSMQIFNMDETSFLVTHRPGKVLPSLVIKMCREREHLYHSCICLCFGIFSSSDNDTPSEDVWQTTASPGTCFKCSGNGWINQELYPKWFINNILPAHPALFHKMVLFLTCPYKWRMWLKAIMHICYACLPIPHTHFNC